MSPSNNRPLPRIPITRATSFPQTQMLTDAHIETLIICSSCRLRHLSMHFVQQVARGRKAWVSLLWPKIHSGMTGTTAHTRDGRVNSLWNWHKGCWWCPSASRLAAQPVDMATCTTLLRTGLHWTHGVSATVSCKNNTRSNLCWKCSTVAKRSDFFNECPKPKNIQFSKNHKQHASSTL